MLTDTTLLAIGLRFASLWIRATLVIVVPLAAPPATCAWKLTVAEAPAARAPMFQKRAPFRNWPPPFEGTNVKPAGSASLTITPVAGPMPWLVAISVKVTTSPGRAVEGFADLDRIREGTTPPKVKVCWPTPGLK